MIAVVDYKKGNLLSVERGLRAAGADARITADPAVIAAASAIVLPGVGAFADAMETMNELGQAQVLRERLAAGVPFLGICLGLHLLFEAGTEGAQPAPTVPGLGILPGMVDRMPREGAGGATFKVPHVGWNTVYFTEDGKNCPLFDGIDDGTYFYFTHSFVSPANDFTVACTTHSITFPCAIQKGNIFGTQFHPEKSSDAGAAVLRNFVDFAAGAGAGSAQLFATPSAVEAKEA